MKLNHSQVLFMIQNHGQSIFGVKFIKSDFTVRSMSCKLHAHNKAIEANKTGRHQSPNKDEYMIRVFDMIKKEFRTINVRTIFEFSINGETYKVENGE